MARQDWTDKHDYFYLAADIIGESKPFLGALFVKCLLTKVVTFNAIILWIINISNENK